MKKKMDECNPHSSSFRSFVGPLAHRKCHVESCSWGSRAKQDDDFRRPRAFRAKSRASRAGKSQPSRLRKPQKLFTRGGWRGARQRNKVSISSLSRRGKPNNKKTALRSRSVGVGATQLAAEPVKKWRKGRESSPSFDFDLASRKDDGLHVPSMHAAGRKRTAQCAAQWFEQWKTGRF